MPMIWRILAVIFAFLLGIAFGYPKRRDAKRINNPSNMNGTFTVCTDDPNKDIFTLQIDDWTLTHIKELSFITFEVRYNPKTDS